MNCKGILIPGDHHAVIHYSTDALKCPCTRAYSYSALHGEERATVLVPSFRTLQQSLSFVIF